MAMKTIEFNQPAWMDQSGPLQEQQKLNRELLEFAKEHWQVTQSLRLFALALADISPERDELLVAYKARLAEFEKQHGYALMSLFQDR